MSTVESEQIVVWELEELYRCLLSQQIADYRDTWRVFVTNTRYQRELQSAAIGVVRARRLPAEHVADIVQEAFVILAERLRCRSNLGFEPKYGEERFLAWIRAVVRSHCRHAADRQRFRVQTEVDSGWASCRAPRDEWRAELADGVRSLDKPLREIVESYSRTGSIALVAEELGLSTTTAWRRFRVAVRQLSDRCSPLTTSGQPVGTTRVIQKW